MVVKAGAVQMTVLLFALGFLGSDTAELLAVQFVLGFTGAPATPMVYLNLKNARYLEPLAGLAHKHCPLLIRIHRTDTARTMNHVPFQSRFAAAVISTRGLDASAEPDQAHAQA